MNSLCVYHLTQFFSFSYSLKKTYYIFSGISIKNLNYQRKFFKNKYVVHLKKLSKCKWYAIIY